ncbi:hypothetical protein BDR03DRAFT_1027536 [Suillus americanus]|nr:hypothetical protein BDR03DRAFT_1027536 [Suillus americanus]
MQATSPFPFANLPTELVLLIFAHAATPTFVKSGDNEPKNPYASALSLCRISKIVRRAVLPELLRTMLLPESSEVVVFRESRNTTTSEFSSVLYACSKHSLYKKMTSVSDFDYAGRVDRIWFGQICEPPLRAPVHRSFALSTTSSLTSSAYWHRYLALGFESLWLLYRCLESAWNSHMNDPEQAETHLLPTYDPCSDDLEHRKYPLPEWMTSVPWDLFKRLRTVSLALPRIVLTVAAKVSLSEENVDVELLTLIDPPHSTYWEPKDINAYTKSGKGRIVSIGVRVKLRGSPIQFSVSLDWEEAWARGLLK